MNARRIIVVGAGGFAREVKWLLAALSSEYSFVGYVVTNTAHRLPREEPSRAEILGDFDWLRANKDRFDCLALGVGSASGRISLSSQLADFGADYWPSLVHPTCQFDRTTCKVHEGAILAAGTIATVNVTFEPFCMVNLSCTIGHEARIGRGSVVNPGTNISGDVQIGAHVLVGTGARILERIRIGDGATVGAGAVVTKDVPEGVTVIGVPARPIPGRD